MRSVVWLYDHSEKEQLPGLKIRKHFVMDFTVVIESDPTKQ